LEILESISKMGSDVLETKLKVLRSMVYKNVNRVRTN